MKRLQVVLRMKMIRRHYSNGNTGIAGSQVLLALLVILLICTHCSTPNEKVVVATAASVQYVMKEIIRDFEKETGIQAEMVVGASGKLTTQIREGAPFDIFVSADTHYPDEIYRKGGGDTIPAVYATGSLIVWTMDTTLNLSFSQVCSNPLVRKIALPNPAIAPYGEAAISALQKSGSYASVKHKLVYGESIAQASHYIVSQAADLGFSALSVVRSPEMSGKGKWALVDTALYRPIEQSALLLRHSADSPKRRKAEAFYRFLFSLRAKELLKKYGYR